MKMIWGLWLLCLAGTLRAVHAGPLRKTGKTENTAAPHEEVNVLMFGVIQLSESFNYVYETTEAKIAKISQTLRRHEGALQKLGRETEQAAEVEQQIKEVIHLLQAQMAKQQAQTETTKDRLASIEREEVELKTKVKKLEMYLNTKMSIKDLQERAEEQSNTLKSLQYLTQFQKENIETQNEKLSKLQKMSEALT
ncbi:angiopoietin-like protein 8 [Cebidichthys violaceus]|uniref:angiopoietin-like protein 8 n=1 Tax=Cebidichthys violaceus TaxID=271503 RepID=UPI0035CA9ACF